MPTTPSAKTPPASELLVSLETVDSCPVIALSGRFDAATAAQFDEAVQTLLDSGAKSCIINMEGLNFISSAGLHSLLGLVRALDARKGWACCCSLGETVNDVFSIAGFAKIFRIFKTLEQALAARPVLNGIAGGAGA